MENDVAKRVLERTLPRSIDTQKKVRQMLGQEEIEQEIVQ